MSAQTSQQPGTAGWDVDRSKKQLDFASAAATQIVKLAIGAGGILLIVYAAKERFFFDVSSLSAIGVLLITVVSFVGLIAAGQAYGIIASLCLVWLGLELRNYNKKATPVRMVRGLDEWPLLIASATILVIFLFIHML